jgi:hypothetical protein
MLHHATSKHGRKVMREIIVLLVAFALAGCNVTSQRNAPIPSGPPPTASVPDKQLFGQARQAVLANLKDPDSAKFGTKLERRQAATRDGRPYEFVCGEVNAKNSFGGYTGAKMFLWYASDMGNGPRTILESTSSDLAALEANYTMLTLCAPAQS